MKKRDEREHPVGMDVVAKFDVGLHIGDGGVFSAVFISFEEKAKSKNKRQPQHVHTHREVVLKHNIVAVHKKEHLPFGIFRAGVTSWKHKNETWH